MAVFRLILGLVFLILSSRVLVWGAVELARIFHVSDVIIGLTIVAVGTSLPELASSVIAARRNEHDIALGNILGSNLFNTLAVVGIAGIIHPIAAEPVILFRDMPVMGGLTLALFIIGYGFRGGRGGSTGLKGRFFWRSIPDTPFFSSRRWFSSPVLTEDLAKLGNAYRFLTNLSLSIHVYPLSIPGV